MSTFLLSESPSRPNTGERVGMKKSNSANLLTVNGYHSSDLLSDDFDPQRFSSRRVSFNADDTSMKLSKFSLFSSRNASRITLLDSAFDLESSGRLTPESKGGIIELDYHFDPTYLANRAMSPAKRQRAFSYIGIAPSRTNFSSLSRGKYAATSSMLSRNWESKRAQTNWGRLQKSFRGEDDASEMIEIEASKELSYSLSVRQGFKFKTTLRHKHAILSVIHHPRIPVHFADGSMGNDVEKVNSDSDTEMDDNDNESGGEDEELRTKALALRPYSLAVLDKKEFVTIWDITKLDDKKPKLERNLDYNEISDLVYLARHSMYAVVIDQRMVKFYTSRLDVTSSMSMPHTVQKIRYCAVSNELIAAGTHIITVWSLTAVHSKGMIKIEPTLRLTLNTELPENAWIDDIYVGQKNRQLIVIIDTSLMSFDLVTGLKMDYTTHIASRKISCVVNHDSYQYMLLGSIDGRIRVVNIARAVVHEFVSHTKEVTSIAIFPSGPLILSAGLDSTVRMYNLKSFKEIFSFHVREPPLGVQLIDNSQLYIHSRKAIEVWSTNQINTNLTTISSQVTKLVFVKGRKVQGRAIVRTSDGVIRILTPINGRTLTATLPLLETDSVIDVAYYPRLERMYILLTGGAIWIFRTDQHPCTIADTWESSEATSERCHKIAIFDGHIRNRTNNSLTYFGFLFGATSNGHLIIYGKGGIIMDRIHLHGKAITNLFCDRKEQLLVSGGEDESIRICSVSPFSNTIVDVLVTIALNFVPTMLCMVGNVICTASAEATIHMFEINLQKREWKIVPGHGKPDDHTDGVIAMVGIRKLGIFITAGKDSSIRVWDRKNRLIREVVFQEPIDGMCLANNRGDLLLAMNNRIDIVRNTSYLPPQHLQALKQRRRKSTKPEQPLPFDDGLIPFTRAPDKQIRELLHLDKDNPLDMFIHRNLESIDVPFKRIEHRTESITNREMMEDLTLSLKMKRQVMTEVEDDDEDDERDLSRTNSSNGLTKAVSLFKNSKGGLLGPVDESERVDSMSPVLDDIIAPSEPQEETVIPNMNNDLINAILEKMQKKKPSIAIAPDGFLPNSGIMSTVNDWLKAHDRYQDANVRIQSYKKKKTKVIQAVDEDKKTKSDMYKARLRKLVDALPEKAEKPVEADQESDEEDEDSPSKLRVGAISKLNNMPNAEVIQQTLEIKLSPVVEKMMEYSWFPDSKIFYPQVPLSEMDHFTIITNSKGHRMRKLKVDTAPESLLPIILETFAINPLEAKMEIVSFIGWVNREFGFRDTTLIEQAYCRHLQMGLLRSLDSADIQLRKTLIEVVIDYNPNNPEIIPTLLMYIDSLFDVLKGKAIQVLKGYGLGCCETAWVIDEIKKLYDQAHENEKLRAVYAISGPPPVEEGEDPPLADLRTLFMGYLRGHLQAYLIASCVDKEIEKRLKDLTIHGLEEKKRRVIEKKEKGSKKKDKESSKKVKKVNGKPDSRPNSGEVENRPPSASTSKKVAEKDKPKAKPKEAPKPALVKVSEDGFDTSRRKTVVFSEPIAFEQKVDQNQKKKETPIGRRLSVLDTPPRGSTPDGPTTEFEPSGEPVLKEETPDVFVAKALMIKQRVKDQKPKSYPPIIDIRFFPLITIPKVEETPETEHPIQILQKPSASDFVNALNYFIVTIELRLEQEEKERLEKLWRENQAAEKARKEAEAKAKYLQFKAKKAAERQARDVERNKRIAGLKGGEEDQEPKSGKIKLSELRTGGVGHTHQSSCHHSRETMDMTIKHFPPITPDNIRQFNSSMAVYLQTLNKTMPLEQVNINPFGSTLSLDAPMSTRKTLKGKRVLRTAPSLTPLHPLLEDDAEIIGQQEMNDRQLTNELDFIRKGLFSAPSHSLMSLEQSDVDSLSFPKLSSDRKFFMPHVAVAWNNMESDQRSSLMKRDHIEYLPRKTLSPLPPPPKSIKEDHSEILIQSNDSIFEDMDDASFDIPGRPGSSLGRPSSRSTSRPPSAMRM